MTKKRPVPLLPSTPRTALLTIALAASLPVFGCRGAEEDGHAMIAREDTREDAVRVGDRAAAGTEGLEATLRRATALADSIEDLLRPVPLMGPEQEAELRRYSNEENLVRARRLGARPANAAALESLVEEGRLVRLEDSTRHWIVRELSASHPYVTPDTRRLLQRLAESFHDRLGERGLPAYRFEVSSVLRTSDDQAALRRTNVNAAGGTSAHEYGTTVDIDYAAYAAPAELPADLVPRSAGEAGRPALEAVARLALERVAARKSLELKAILGEVMREAQARGDVLVTLERQQPVYHITVAGRLP